MIVGLRAVMLEPVMKIEIRTPENFLGEVIGDLLDGAARAGPAPPDMAAKYTF